MKYGGNKNYIIFSSGNRYEYQATDKAIYIISNAEALRIANDVTFCNFETYMQEEKTIIRVIIQFKKMTEPKIIEYVLGYGNMYNNYENEENYVSTKTYDLSEVVVAGAEILNLFDKDNANILDMYIDINNQELESTPVANRTKSIWISCTPNTTYTIKKIAGARIVVGAFSSIEENTVADVIVSDANEGDGLNSLTITTGNSSQYLVVDLYDAQTDTASFDTIKNSLQIKEIDTIDKFNYYKIPILLEGINISSEAISETKYIYLSEPLRKIDNIVYDELDVVNGKVERYIDIENNEVNVMFTAQLEDVIFPISTNIVGTTTYSIIYNSQ